MSYKFIDLFCGIGSFHYSFNKMGWECVLASDNDESTHDVYEKNYGMRPVGDIYDIDPKDIPAYDVLCAGFPCHFLTQVNIRDLMIRGVYYFLKS